MKSEKTITHNLLHDVSDKDLYEEIQNRHIKRHSLENQERVEQAQKNLLLIPNLLLCIEHSRTSCNDKNLQNAYCNDARHPRCERCYLLVAQKDQYWPTDVDLRINIEISSIL